jgi:hypothetical protein
MNTDHLKKFKKAKGFACLQIVKQIEESKREKFNS